MGAFAQMRKGRTGVPQGWLRDRGARQVSPTYPMPTILAKTVEYEHDGVKLKGFLAFKDDLAGKRPGVLVFPEWWGLNDLARTRAKHLAELGYVAFAADVYGEGTVVEIAQPETAANMANTLRADTTAWRGRAMAALKQLKGLPNVDASKIAAVGYCLDSALQLAYTGADLKAVATFHSGLPTPTEGEANAIRAKILVCLGGADPFVSARSIADFRAALDDAGVNLDFVTYPGVLHSFTSPEADKAGNPGLKYDRNADEDSFRRMKEHLREAFGHPAVSIGHAKRIDNMGRE